MSAEFEALRAEQDGRDEERASIVAWLEYLDDLWRYEDNLLGWAARQIKNGCHVNGGYQR